MPPRHALHDRASFEPDRHTPERFICAATGSNARIYGLDSGLLAPGKAADIVLIDAPDGGTQKTALAPSSTATSLRSAQVVTAGVPRFVGRSRNTPATDAQGARRALARPQDFSGQRRIDHAGRANIRNLPAPRGGQKNNRAA
jgi:enamidase